MSVDKEFILDEKLNLLDIYTKEVVPKLHAYEVYRRREYFRYKIMMSIGIPALVIPFLTFIYADINGIDVILTKALGATIIGGLIGFFLIAFALIKPKDFCKKIKYDSLSKVFKALNNFDWKTDSECIFEEDLSDSGLFENFNMKSTDDSFRGSYNGVEFRIAEIRLRTVHPRLWVPITVFKGVALKFKLNKNIDGRTSIFTKREFVNKTALYTLFLTYFMFVAAFLIGIKDFYIYAWIVLLHILSMVALKMYPSEGKLLNEVKLEDIQFCRRFNVCSTSQIEARYLLTTAFMERLLNLKSAFDAKNMRCSFYGDSLMIAFSTNKDLFEIGSLFKSLEDPTSINAFYDELSSIYKMIDYFKLDEKTGL